MRGAPVRFMGALLVRGGSGGFALAAVLGFGFSMAVVLATVGIMDGFEKSLKEGLRRSSGDVSLRGRRGPFVLDGALGAELSRLGAARWAPFAEARGLAVAGGRARGVLVRGVGPDAFREVTGLAPEVGAGRAALGAELARALGVGPGDRFLLSTVGGEGALAREFNLGGVVEHGVHRKDMRYAYVGLSELQALLGVGDRVHGAFLKARDGDAEALARRLREGLPGSFAAFPFWHEFSLLLRAVEAEKAMIALVLQVVVAVAAFNVLAYVVFLNERRAREVFLFRALGLSGRRLVLAWGAFTAALWAAACLAAGGFFLLMGLLVERLPILALPSDVYHLSEFGLSLSPGAAALVFALALVWLVLVNALALRRMGREPPVRGLRGETT